MSSFGEAPKGLHDLRTFTQPAGIQQWNYRHLRGTGRRTPNTARGVRAGLRRFSTRCPIQRHPSGCVQQQSYPRAGATARERSSSPASCVQGVSSRLSKRSVLQRTALQDFSLLVHTKRSPPRQAATKWRVLVVTSSGRVRQLGVSSRHVPARAVACPRRGADALRR